MGSPIKDGTVRDVAGKLQRFCSSKPFIDCSGMKLSINKLAIYSLPSVFYAPKASNSFLQALKFALIQLKPTVSTPFREQNGPVNI